MTWCVEENPPRWEETKEVLGKYEKEGVVDESVCMSDRTRERKKICEQRWVEEVRIKKTLDVYAAVKHEWKKEKYTSDHGDRRGSRLKFD